MGQKVHPTGFRLGIIKDWNSIWYANSAEFPGLLEKDLIRYWIIEYAQHCLARNNDSLDTLRTLMEKHNLEMFILDPSGGLPKFIPNKVALKTFTIPNLKVIGYFSVEGRSRISPFLTDYNDTTSASNPVYAPSEGVGSNHFIRIGDRTIVSGNFLNFSQEKPIIFTDPTQF